MQIGETQTLRIERDSPHGFFLSDGEDVVLLPVSQTPEDVEIGDKIEVFVYTDSEDRPIATRKKPLAEVGDFKQLRVVDVSTAGAFFDWGLDKDLFCALREQRQKLQVGDTAVVYVYYDVVSHRIACSMRLGRFLLKEGKGLTVGQKVEIMVYGQGYRWIDVIVDNKYKGSLFMDEYVEELAIGETRTAYVKQIRDQDGRIAISLRPQGFQAVLGEGDRLLDMMYRNGGVLRLSDRSSPEEIQHVVGLSKGAFKKLIGSLYREGRIVIEADRIKLNRE